jgi:hypothetical protein
MSDISSISGLGSLSNVLPTSNKNRMAGGRGNDGDNDGSKVSGGVGRANFMSAIEQALGQSLSRTAGVVTAAVTPNSASATSPAQDPQSALNPFLHNLFAALNQATGSGNGASATDNPSNMGNPAVSGVGHHHHGGSNLTASIQSLLQQLSSSSQSASSSNSSTSTSSQISGTDAISNLSSSFQGLMSAVDTSQGRGASATAPSVQSFLQNLLQDLKGGQNISGAVISTKA